MSELQVYLICALVFEGLILLCASYIFQLLMAGKIRKEEDLEFKPKFFLINESKLYQHIQKSVDSSRMSYYNKKYRLLIYILGFLFIGLFLASYIMDVERIRIPGSLTPGWED